MTKGNGGNVRAFILGAVLLVVTGAAWLGLGLLPVVHAEVPASAVPMDRVDIQRVPSTPPLLRFTDTGKPSVAACYAWSTNDMPVVESVAAASAYWYPGGHDLLRELTTITPLGNASWTKPTLSSYDGKMTVVILVNENQEVTRVMASQDDAEHLASLLVRSALLPSATWWLDEEAPHLMTFRFDLGEPQSACN